MCRGMISITPYNAKNEVSYYCPIVLKSVLYIIPLATQSEDEYRAQTSASSIPAAPCRDHKVLHTTTVITGKY